MTAKKYLLVPGRVANPHAAKGSAWVGILDLIERHKLDPRECVGIHCTLYRVMPDYELLKLIVITPGTPYGASSSEPNWEPSRACGRYDRVREDKKLVGASQQNGFRVAGI